MQAFLMFLHISVSILLIIVVLLQSGKSADLAGAFGGAGSQSTFGPRGAASLLSKITTTLAVLFMVTSLMLWILASKKSVSSSSSVLGNTETPVIEQTAPAAGEQPAGEEEKPAAAPVEAEDQEAQGEPLPTGTEENKGDEEAQTESSK